VDLGLSGLVEAQLGLPLDKQQQCSAWGKVGWLGLSQGGQDQANRDGGRRQAAGPGHGASSSGAVLIAKQGARSDHWRASGLACCTPQLPTTPACCQVQGC